jgi:NitT/TauT family transport system ATP-binding protein
MPTCCPGRTALEKRLLPLEIVEPYRRDFSKQKYAGKAHALLASVGLEGCADKYPWSSRAACSSAPRSAGRSSHEPEILLLDEPFGALDAFTREELWMTLRDVQAARTRHRDAGDARPARRGCFLADTVYVMSAARDANRRTLRGHAPRPRDME